MSSAPKAPDPYQTAAAQTQSNQQTAAYNAALNRVSTYTPYGNQVYSQTGTDSTGAPTWRSDISLAPEAQQQLDNELKQNNAISALSQNLTDQIGSSINTPMSDQATSNDAARNAYYSKATAFLDPQYNNMQNDLNATLANKGVVEGSEAYNRAQDELGRQRTLAYNTAANDAITQGQTAQQQALANAITLKNQPINQLSAIRNGTQISNPSFPTTPGSSAAGTDISGLIQQNYQTGVANANNFNSGLFSLGAAALMASDRRLKHAIKRIGTHRRGFGIYEFSYLGSARRVVGYMAQEVARIVPAAVIRMPSGFLSVNYGMLG